MGSPFSKNQKRKTNSSEDLWGDESPQSTLKEAFHLSFKPTKAPSWNEPQRDAGVQRRGSHRRCQTGSRWWRLGRICPWLAPKSSTARSPTWLCWPAANNLSGPGTLPMTPLSLVLKGHAQVITVPVLPTFIVSTAENIKVLSHPSSQGLTMFGDRGGFIIFPLVTATPVHCHEWSQKRVSQGTTVEPWSVWEGLTIPNFKLNYELRVWGSGILCTGFDCKDSKFLQLESSKILLQHGGESDHLGFWQVAQMILQHPKDLSFRWRTRQAVAMHNES